ncbi:MAG: DUF5979 domain-containing protein, partial [Propionibacteriaceae bacterium]|nr:DUF5979 domain-containing protein [Propionibacteriaceae bacterium]
GLSVAAGATADVATAWGDAGGSLSVVETVPDEATAGGVWRLASGSCVVTAAGGGVSTVPMAVTAGTAGSQQWTAQLSQPLAEGAAADCVLVNEFTPAGRVQLRKSVDPAGLAPDDALPADFAYTVTQYAVDAAGNAAPTGLAAAAAVHVDSDHLTGAAVPAADWPAGFAVSTAASRYQYVLAETLPAATAAGAWRVSDVTCAGAQPTVPWTGGSSVTVELTAVTPTADCVFTNEWRPSPVAILTVVKRGSDDTALRSAPAVLTYRCAQSGLPGFVEQDLVLPVGSTTAATGFESFAALTCQVLEKADGAAAGVTPGYTVQATRDGQPIDPAPDLGEEFAIGLGETVAFEVANTYTPPPPPPQITVAKHTSADPAIRDAAAVLTLTCAADGQTVLDESLEVAPGLAAGAAQFSAAGATTCVLDEPVAGQTADYAVSPTLTAVNNGQPMDPQPSLGQPFAVAPGDDISFLVDNAFTLIPPPAPEPYQRVFKRAEGADGVFDFTDIGFSDGHAESVTGLAVPQGTTVLAATHVSTPGLPAAPLTVTEDLSAAAAPGGEWRLTSGACEVSPVGGGASQTVGMDIVETSPGVWTATTATPLSPDDNADCHLSNSFVPNGQLRLIKTIDPAGLADDAFPSGSVEFDYTVSQWSGPTIAHMAATGRVYAATATLRPTDLSEPVTAAAGGLPWPDGWPVSTAGDHYQYVIAEAMPAPTAAGSWRLAEVNCSPAGAVVPGTLTADSVAVELTADVASATCELVNRWTPAARLTIVKEGTADTALRSGQSTLAVECHNADPSGSPIDYRREIVLAPGSTASALVVAQPADLVCTVAETADGAAADVQWTHRETLTDRGAALTAPDLGQEFTVRQGQDLTYTVANHYDAPAQLTLVKLTTGDQDARPDPAQLALRCTAADGRVLVDGGVTVEPGQVTAFTTVR